MDIKLLLEKMVQFEASDLHLKVGVPPIFRVHGKLKRYGQIPVTVADMNNFIQELMTKRQQQEFLSKKELDFAIGVKGLGRFRINAFFQKGSISLAIRHIPDKIKSFEELNLPPILKELSLKPRGIILVTGTTGSGKSTTLAAMIDYINQNQSRHIITIEDPIEYVIRDKKSIIEQREVGSDTHSFANALKYVLRQDPDVILIGEIRDKETMDVALKAADTGHLVLSTLHTLNATETINRIISFYPAHQHQYVRVVLASTLIAVISQRLIPTKDGKGRVPACEILIVTPRIRELILDPVKTMEIPKAIEEGKYAYGMQSFDQAILKLYKEGKISLEEALLNSSNPEKFKMALKGIESAGMHLGEEEIRRE